jgi:hypothetical protein
VGYRGTAAFVPLPPKEGEDDNRRDGLDGVFGHVERELTGLDFLRCRGRSVRLPSQLFHARFSEAIQKQIEDPIVVTECG